MNPRFHLLFVVVLSLVTSVGRAESGVLHSLIAPTTVVTLGQSIDVHVAVLNGSAVDATAALPDTLNGELVGAGGREPIVLKASEAASGSGRAIAPGQFRLLTYRLTIPASMTIGRVTLETRPPDSEPVRAVLNLVAASAPAAETTDPATQRPPTTLVRAEPAAAALRRAFADRLGAHEPVYFIYGADAPTAKFQFSFKYKLLDFRDLAPQRMLRTVHFAFTQRSLWDIDATSSPFYDTSYMPGIVYEALAPKPEKTGGMFTWLGIQAAFKHESNGRDGLLSRSMNVVYARTAFAFGRLDGWHLLAIPEAFTYVMTLEDNPDIADYRGYGKLHLVLGRNDGPSLMASVWAGKDFNHASVQLDLNYPIRTRLLNFETYLLVQYFNGYGESLLSYREQSETVRAGFSLVR